MHPSQMQHSRPVPPAARLQVFVAMALMIAVIAAALADTPSARAAAPGAPDTLLSLPGGRHIETIRVSPDGRTLVFIADLETNDVFEAYSVPLDGSAPPTRISGDTIADGDVDTIKISPDSSRVVFRGDLLADDLEQLFSVPIGGGPRTLISQFGALQGDVSSGYEISPDSRRVVYMRGQVSDNDRDLYSVPIDGGLIVRLNDLLPADASVWSFKIAPDSSRVLFRSDMEFTDNVQLFTAPIAGGTPVRVSGAQAVGPVIQPHGVVTKFTISLDSQRVVYRAQQTFDTEQDIYMAPSDGDGTPPVRLNADLAPDATVDQFYELSPDSRRVVYRADLETPGVLEIYSVDISGGPSTKLSPTPVAGDSVGRPRISADAQRVVFRGVLDTEGVGELYSVPITGGAATKLNIALEASGDVDEIQLVGDRVVYTAVINGPDEFDLYSVPLEGGASTQLNRTDGQENYYIYDDLEFTPDGARVAFLIEDVTTNDFEVHASPVTGGGSVALEADLESLIEFQEVLVADNETAVIVYRETVTNERIRVDVVDLAPRCRGELATITGTDGDDVLTGTQGPDVIVGLAGNDEIRGMGGDDLICAGAGNDDVHGGGGRDRIFGNGGDDSIRGDKGRDDIRGGGGDDDIAGNGGRDQIRGGKGEDTIRGGGKGDVLKGGKHDDVLRGNKGGDTLRGGNGNDALDGGSGTDDCRGGNGADTIAACE